MHRLTSHSKSSLFLMEMIICLLFFALTCSVCIRLFSVSYVNRHKARDLNHMQEYLTTCAELLESWDGSLEDYAALLEHTGASPHIHSSAGKDLWTTTPNTSYLGTISLYFNKNWQFSVPDSAGYTLNISVYRFSKEKSARISFWKGIHDFAADETMGTGDADPRLLLYQTMVRYPASLSKGGTAS